MAGSVCFSSHLWQRRIIAMIRALGRLPKRLEDYTLARPPAGERLPDFTTQHDAPGSGPYSEEEAERRRDER